MYNNFYDELYHYGIPGMQKGRRRFTNADGTLNAAGKERYRDGKVGSGYTQARAAANKQRNSMNSQAALRSGSVGSSYAVSRAGKAPKKSFRSVPSSSNTIGRNGVYNVKYNSTYTPIPTQGSSMNSQIELRSKRKIGDGYTSSRANKK